MSQMMSSSRAEKGCEEYFYAEDVLDPGLIHVRELWHDQAALDRHFASEHIATWRAAWLKLGTTDRDLRLYEVGQPRSTLWRRSAGLSPNVSKGPEIGRAHV